MAEYFDAPYVARRYQISAGKKEEVILKYLNNVKAHHWSPFFGFDEVGYVEFNPDVKAAVGEGEFVCGFHHWTVQGLSERRLGAIPSIAMISPEQTAVFARELGSIFDVRWYEEHYLDGRSVTDIQVLRHYLTTGLRKGLSPSSKFDEEFYRLYYADVRAEIEAGRLPNGAFHYLISGRQERRVPIHDRGQLLRAKLPDATKPVALQEVAALERRLKPLSVALDTRQRKRVNVFIPSVDPDIFFGGYIAFTHFLCELSALGASLRLLVMEDIANRAWFMRGIASNARWTGALAGIEIEDCRERGHAIKFSPNDVLIAYSSWTHLDAQNVATELGLRRPIFFIQEYEAVFHKHDGHRFIVEGSYRKPHTAIFNTHLLQEYFAESKLGIFGQKNRSYITFEHVLAQVSPPDRKVLKRRAGRRRLAFYARPEQHAARNLTDIGIMALRKAHAQQVFDATWEFVGLGTTGDEFEIDIASGVKLRMMPRVAQHEYEGSLRSFDVGLSLMWAPHPSVLPFELAKAGVVTVTNEFGSRTKKRMRPLGNIVVAEPSVEGIVAALRTAVSQAEDADARIRGACVPGPSSWQKAFDSRFFSQLQRAHGASLF